MIKDRIDALEILLHRRPRIQTRGPNSCVYLWSINLILRQSRQIYSVTERSATERLDRCSDVYEMIDSTYRLTFKNKYDEIENQKETALSVDRLQIIQKHAFDAYDAFTIEPCSSVIEDGLNGILSELARLFPSWKPLHLDYVDVYEYEYE